MGNRQQRPKRHVLRVHRGLALGLVPCPYVLAIGGAAGGKGVSRCGLAAVAWDAVKSPFPESLRAHARVKVETNRPWCGVMLYSSTRGMSLMQFKDLGPWSETPGDVTWDDRIYDWMVTDCINGHVMTVPARHLWDKLKPIGIQDWQLVGTEPSGLRP